MKKASSITLVLVPALWLMGCRNSPSNNTAQQSTSKSAAAQDPKDPCNSSYWDDTRCEEAVRRGGYHYGGTWWPMVYPYPFSLYRRNYEGFMRSGGVRTPVPTEQYSPSYRAPGVSRGGFGSSFPGGSASA